MTICQLWPGCRVTTMSLFVVTITGVMYGTPLITRHPFIALHSSELIEAYKQAYENAGYAVVTRKSSPGILFDDVLFAKSKDPRKYIASEHTFKNDSRCEYSCFEFQRVVEPDGYSDSRSSAIAAYHADERKVFSTLPPMTPSGESSHAAYYEGIPVDKVMDVYEETYREAGFDVQPHGKDPLSPYLKIILMVSSCSYQIELLQEFRAKTGSLAVSVHASWHVRQMPGFPTVQKRNAYFSRYRECGLKAQNAIKNKIGGFASTEEEPEEPPKKFRSELERKIYKLKRR
jgi:hypothetical protein